MILKPARLSALLPAMWRVYDRRLRYYRPWTALQRLYRRYPTANGASFNIEEAMQIAAGRDFDPTWCALFQETDFTNPVTAVGQPVGSIRDMSGRGQHFVSPGVRPLLSRRVNLVLDAPPEWDAPGVILSPVSADLLDGRITRGWRVAGGGELHHRVVQHNAITAPAGYETAIAFYLSAGTAQYTWVSVDAYPIIVGVMVDFSVGVAQFQSNVGDVAYDLFMLEIEPGLWQVSFKITFTETTQYRLGCGPHPVVAGEDVVLWGVDARYSHNLVGRPQYQWVNGLHDYDERHFPAYLSFNGTTQWMRTLHELDMTDSDEVTVVVAQEKARDVGDAVLLSLGATYGADGTFAMLAHQASTDSSYTFQSAGTSSAEASAIMLSAPDRAIVSGLASVSRDEATLRHNDEDVSQSTDEQGSGNYSEQFLFIGSQDGAAGMYQGAVFGLSVIGTTLVEDDLLLLESLHDYEAPLPPLPWLLETGEWSDAGIWIDTSTWIDGE